jgi:hypothetical protein
MDEQAWWLALVEKVIALFSQSEGAVAVPGHGRVPKGELLYHRDL